MGEVKDVKILNQDIIKFVAILAMLLNHTRILSLHSQQCLDFSTV